MSDMNAASETRFHPGAFMRREWPHWCALIAMFTASAWAWEHVTLPIPTHWNFRGEVDGYGGRFEGLLLTPLITLGLYVLLLLLPRIDPGRANYASFTGPYAVIRASLTLMMGGMHALLVATALGYPVDAGRWIPVGAGALLVVMGNVMGKVRPNFFVGIRTPWTLTSTRSWEKTHRMGGWLFLVAGVLLAAGSLSGVPEVMIGVGVFGAASLVWLIYYSWREWRRDPDRVSVTGTRPASEDR
ncbi:MAG: SdpI family protein [Chloroflexi bacterium]|nr:SdpI family protein [Chloroflexota bacterium]